MTDWLFDNFKIDLTCDWSKFFSTKNKQTNLENPCVSTLLYLPALAQDAFVSFNYIIISDSSSEGDSLVQWNQTSQFIQPSSDTYSFTWKTECFVFVYSFQVNDLKQLRACVCIEAATSL